MVDGDDPFKPNDATVVRPRPGAGKRAASDGLGARPFSLPASATPQVPETSRDGLAIGLNPLLQAASPLLRLAGQARAVRSAIDIPALQRQAREDMRAFEAGALGAGVSREIMLAARYVLCATVDEAVMSTPGGAQSEWAQHPLLVEMHREAWGGEKFFEMLDRISSDPARHLDLMELQYVCLALGFMGKYHMMERGYERLADVRAGLFEAIARQRGPTAEPLSLRWRGLEDRRKRLVHYVPWWVAATAATLVLFGAFVFYQSKLAALAEPVRVTLGNVRVQPPPAAARRSGPTLKMLLADLERRGALQVDEANGVTTVTLRGNDLFASASADVNRAYEGTLTRVGEALNQVPGRVWVEGHTDNQPLRSFKYNNNFELSVARAESVSEVLKSHIDVPSRLTSRGRGSSTKYPERSRNRRVEIIHVPGT